MPCRVALSRCSSVRNDCLNGSYVRAYIKRGLVLSAASLFVATVVPIFVSCLATGETRHGHFMSTLLRNVVVFPAFVALADGTSRGINCVLHGSVCTPNGTDRSFATRVSRLTRLWRLTVMVGWPMSCRFWRGKSFV